MEVRERLADGRYGPVFLAHDRNTDALVVLRIFEAELDLGQRAILLDALERACEAPLQHASIGRPIGCGIDHDRVYVIHTRLPGQPADAWLRQHGRASLADLLVAIAGAAAAIDFAAAVGVHHGALTTGDLILDGDTAGVTGWGIEQARAAAGLTQATPSHAGDIAALASAVYELIAQADAAQAQRVFERAWSTDAEAQFQTALEFAAALQQVAPLAPAGEALEQFAEVESPTDIVAFADVAAADEPFDVPLRDEHLGRVSPPFDIAQSVSSDRPAGSARPDQPRRAQEPAYVPAPAFVLHETPPRRVFPTVAIAVLTLAIGFAGGWVVGHQENDEPVTVAPPVAAATTGRALNDVPLVEPQIVPSDTEAKSASEAKSPVAAQTPPAPRPAPRADTAREEPRPADAEAVLQVDSRPRGAQVYVDGRLIGRTPAIAGGLKPGRHMVRMRLSGHREWATDVTVAAGEHARIGGSLEELY